MRAGLRGLVSSAVAGVLAAILLVAGARWLMPQPVHGPVAEGAWTARSRAMFTPIGFFGGEFDPVAERHFSWTGETAALDFPRLNRAVAYLVTLQIRGGRPPDAAPGRLRITVDDRVVVATDVIGGDSQVQFEIPQRAANGATVALDVSPAYRPGPSDRRALGVIVNDVGVSPVNQAFRPVAGVVIATAVAVMACVWGVWIAGVRGALFPPVAAAVAAGFAWLMWQDAAFAGSFADRLLRIGIGAGLTGALIGAIRMRWPTIGGVPEWSVAAGLVLAASAIKLAIYWHPLAIVGDALFHVHRAQLVHAGSYFFTSVTPRPFFEFPYPIALYVAAQPWWSWFPAELDLVRLLRALSIAADALVGVALYGAVRRQWPDRRAAFLVAALWPFARAPLEALTNANLTNLFGQGIFGIALAGLAWLAASSSVSWPALAILAALLTVAFLSHFGTFTVGLVMLGVVAAALVTLGRAHTRRVGVWVCAVTLAAMAVSWVVYYSNPRFRDVYQQTYASVAAGERDDSSKITAAPLVKLQRWWSGVGDDYGRPGVIVLALAAIGLRGGRSSPADRRRHDGGRRLGDRLAAAVRARRLYRVHPPGESGDRSSLHPAGWCRDRRARRPLARRSDRRRGPVRGDRLGRLADCVAQPRVGRRPLIPATNPSTAPSGTSAAHSFGSGVARMRAGNAPDLADFRGVRLAPAVGAICPTEGPGRTYEQLTRDRFTRSRRTVDRRHASAASGRERLDLFARPSAPGRGQGRADPAAVSRV